MLKYTNHRVEFFDPDLEVRNPAFSWLGAKYTPGVQ